ncbi:MAG: RDD family protein [Planctomycetota bacterium]
MNRTGLISLLALLWQALYHTAAVAQPPPLGAVGPSVSERPSHGWAVIERRGEPFLLHLAPREPGAMHEAAEPGSVRPVRALAEWPDALAGLEDRVFLFYPPEPAADSEGSFRPVFSIRAVPSAIGGMWAQVPAGLMDSLPALPARGRLIGVAAHGTSVSVLERSAGHIALWSFDADSSPAVWEQIELPPALTADEPNALAIMSYSDGLLIARRDSTGSRAWVMRQPDGWTETQIDGWSRFWSAHWRHGFGREILVATPDHDAGHESGRGLSLWRLGTASPTRLAGLGGGTPGAPVVLPTPGRLVIVRQQAGGDAASPPAAIDALELSLITGRSLHDGPAANSARVPVGELRMLAVALVLMMVFVLVVIVRPDPQRAWSVPDGWVLADPGRRLIASLADLMLIAWVLSPAFGVSMRQILTLEVLVHPSPAWLSVPATAVSGWIAMSVWEATLGLTPGKFMTGIRVRRASSGPGIRVSLFWCLVRNAMKWLSPPVAMLALFDQTGRHRGDAAAGAVVVTPDRGTSGGSTPDGGG